jgi:acetoin:2,6-dichlorophenolindophenol oxidoreductase subunit alpha
MTAGEGAFARAQSFGIPSVQVDGNDVRAVDQAAASMVKDIRAGGGPRFLHAVTYRFKGHVSVDPGTYRDPEEVKIAIKNDPLLAVRKQLLSEGVSNASLEALEAEVNAEIVNALAVAEAAPWPVVADAYQDIMTTGAGVWV